VRLNWFQVPCNGHRPWLALIHRCPPSGVADRASHESETRFISHSRPGSYASPELVHAYSVSLLPGLVFTGQRTHFHERVFLLLRMLVFSPDSITGVQVRLDDEEWMLTEHIGGPLYVAEWHPRFYNTGLHYVHVRTLSDQNV